MEQIKKQKQMEFHDKYEKQKNKFFQQVFRRCQSTFSFKQFQFLVKCIIPHRIVNNRNAGNDHKLIKNYQKYQQSQDMINVIHPNILSIPRKFNFYQQKNLQQIMIQKKNRRILTTPTQRIKKEIKFDQFQGYQFFKKMKIRSQNLANDKTIPRLNNKRCNEIQIFSPQPLFYPSNNIKIQRTFPKFTPKTLRRSKTRGCFRNYCLTLDKRNQMSNYQLIPQSFIEALKISKKNNPLPKTAHVKNSIK